MSEVLAAAALRVFADPRWGKPCLAYHVQIPVLDEAARALCQVQTALETVLPVLRPIPCEALHISVYGVIPVGWESAAKETYWNQVSEDVLGILARSTGAAHPFALEFDRLRVDPYAVIALAAHWPPVVDELRLLLRTAALSAGIAAPSYSVVHCTLARFSHIAELSAAIVTQAQALPLHVVVNVDRVRLVRERVYPSLELDVLAVYRLTPASE